MDIAWLEIADSPDVWRRAGFVVDEKGRCVIGTVEHRLVGPRSPIGSAGDERSGGLARWGVSGIDPSITEIDGLSTLVVDAPDRRPPPQHPNGVFRIDHLVLRTSSTPRTVAAFAEVGLERRGGRTTTSAGDQVDMTFFWAGEILLELVGPPQPDVGGPECRFGGIAYATDDLDGAVALLGDLSTTPVAAVQAGRRITALTAAAGSSLPIAFMTPHVRSH
jgi:hypothetical protein